MIAIVQINFVSVQLPINVTVCLYQNLIVNYTVVREEDTEALIIAETFTHQGPSNITLNLMSELISRDQSYLVVVMVSTVAGRSYACLLYTSPSPRDATLSRMPSSA